MTIQGILKNLSAEDLELTKRYYKSIQPFTVQPCTCRAGGLCVHLAAMMCDMEERKTVFFSGRMQE